MLTYRQLLQKCNREVLNHLLLSKTIEGLKHNSSKGENLTEKAWNTVINGYGHVIDVMLAKPVKHPEYAIIIDLVPEEKYLFAGQEETSPAFLDVAYYNSRVELLPEGASPEEGHKGQYHKRQGFGLCAWGDYVDSDIVVSPDAALFIGNINFLEKLAAEVLWEQTFHGYTEEESTAFKESLYKQIDNIKKGKVKTKLVRKKKKGEKYDIRVAENLLKPIKKKKKK